jgi:hypothetical protein
LDLKLVRRSSAAARRLAATGLALASLSSCAVERKCAGEILADDGISSTEVAELRARVIAGGGSVTARAAFADVLWQEAERRRMNLPGGERAAVSRKDVVRGHGRRLLDGKTTALRSDPEALPPDVRLTECGQRFLAENTGR